MGANESRPSAGASKELGRLHNARLIKVPKQGYHVVRVAQGSPAQHAGFEPFFDFCVGINGHPLLDMELEYPPGIQVPNTTNWVFVDSNEGKLITLNVWNTKLQAFRDVPIVPSRTWSQTTNTNVQPSLLGLTLRQCRPADAMSHVWHILHVLEGSPADSAGLVPYGDYVIGWRGGPLETESDFVQLVEHHANQHLALYVYNTDYDHTREVVIVPNRDWGGEGLLGCGIGSGLLHRIPKPQRTFEDSEEFAAAPPLVYEPRGQPRAQISAAQNARPEASMPSNLTGVTVSMHAQEEE